MVKTVETDDRVPLSTQLEQDVGSVVVMNKFNVGPDEIKEFIRVYEETTKYFKQQHGFISTQLHRGSGGSTAFVTYEYESQQITLNMHSAIKI
jgi:quinol monooxygenase YgiN